MRFYTLSPSDVPENQILFPMLRPVFIEKGHSFVNNIEESDCVLFDLHARQFDYKQSDINWVISSGIFVATFDEWDRGGMSSDKWPYPLTDQQESVFHNIVINFRNSIHFCRLLDKRFPYSREVYPYEKPISYEEPLLTPEELFNRTYDICFIANHSPSRERIAKAIERDGRLKSIIRIGEPKVEFNNFVNVHRTAKLFISSGAGGYTDERKQCLFSIAGLIQEDHDQLLLHPFAHLENCIKISNPPTQSELDIIFEYCNNKDLLYSIYKSNYDFMKTFYSESYISNFILDKIEKQFK